MRLLVSLLLSACGLEPSSQPQAVENQQAVLGLHPVKRDGTVVYKLLVCKKLASGSYQQEMFDDDSICREVLLAKDGKEVFFRGDHADNSQNLQTMGLVKGAAIVLPLMLVTVVAGTGALKWLRSLRLNNLNKSLEKYQAVQQQLTESSEELKKRIDEIEKIIDKLFKDDPDRYPVYFVRRKPFKSKQTAIKNHAKVEAKLDNIDELVKKINKVLRAQGGKELADAKRELIEFDRQRPLNFGRKIQVALSAGATMFTAIIVNKADRFNWGYGERQLASHWYRVFYKSGDFNHAEPVDELLPIIRAIASTFNYRVNERALELL